MNEPSKIISYVYKFEFADRSKKEFAVKLDSKTLNLIRIEKRDNPEWTELSYQKCPNCSLDEKKYKYCPVSASLIEIVEFFRDSMSYDEADIIIECAERGYLKHTTLQQAISSLIGIYMVTCGCPVMEKLKPMVRFHLPFASIEETKYRAISMYLTAQYFMQKNGKEPDWELKNLAKIYDDVHVVNDSICRRLTGIKVRDASLNALVRLDFFTSNINMAVTKEKIREIESLFEAYFK